MACSEFENGNVADRACTFIEKVCHFILLRIRKAQVCVDAKKWSNWTSYNVQQFVLKNSVTVRYGSERRLVFLNKGHLLQNLKQSVLIWHAIVLFVAVRSAFFRGTKNTKTLKNKAINRWDRIPKSCLAICYFGFQSN